MTRIVVTFFGASLAAAAALAVSACSGGTIPVGSSESSNNEALQKNKDGTPTGDGGACAYDDGTTSYDPDSGVTTTTPGTGSYKVGDTFKSPDGCNTCSCTKDGIACTTLACAPGACTYGGTSYAVGATFKSTDGCNTCSCEAGGMVPCTADACVYSCPASKTIDCMPIISPANAPLCSGPEHEWIVKNCDVTFAL